MFDDSLIDHIIEEKILHHTPVYRQTKKLKQIGINFIKTQNQDNWIHRYAEALLPLYHLLQKDLLTSPYLQADESTLKILRINKHGDCQTGYIWLLHNP